MIDLKRLPTELNVKLVSQTVFRSQRSFGAAALEWCWLAAGRCHIYLHGKHMLWDYVAGLLIAEEAGCVTCDISGNEVFEPSLKPKKVVAAVDLYVSDFGELQIVPSRFVRSRDVFVLDPNYARVAYLQTTKQTPLARTGHSERRLISVEYGLQVDNEKAHGVIADINPAL